MKKVMNKIKERSFLLKGFLICVSSLAALNLLNYPYIPDNGVIFTSFFLLLTFIGVTVLYLEQSDSINFYGALFSSFAVATLVSRVFVNTAGIATPKSTGALGMLKIEQIWIGGIHLHHYWIGVSMLIAAFYMSKSQFPDVEKGLMYGTGLALLVDELGIILAGHTYHSWISYLGLSVSYTLLLGFITANSSISTSAIWQLSPTKKKVNPEH